MTTEHQQGAGHSVIVDRVPAGVWRVDPSGSQLNIRARSLFGLLPVNGFFERFEGELRAEANARVSGALAVEAASIRTGIDQRDRRLCSAEFLDVAAHPLIRFELASIGPGAAPELRLSEEQRMTLSGVLSVRGVEIPLSAPVTVIAHGDHLHLECRARIDHHAAGLGWKRPGLIGRAVSVEVALTLRLAPNG